MTERLTKRAGNGVQYDNGKYVVTCYPENNNLTAVDKIAVKLCDFEDREEHRDAEWLVNAWDGEKWVLVPYEKHKHTDPFCSACYGAALHNEEGEEVVSDFCPHCGAKMKSRENKSSNIGQIIKQIDALFRNYNRSTRAFTVDYDEDTDGLYCYYTPHINDMGYVVLNDFLFVCETTEKDLRILKEYLDKNGIRSRIGYEWSVEWGCSEE